MLLNLLVFVYHTAKPEDRFSRDSFNCYLQRGMKVENIFKQIKPKAHYYARYLEKVEGVYCFGLERPSVRPSVTNLRQGIKIS